MKEKFWIWLAWQMPNELVLWCAARLMAHATAGVFSFQIVPELTALDALKRWNQGTEADGLRAAIEATRKD